MATPLAEPTLHKQVCEVIDWIRPALRSDGGDLEVVGVDAQGVVQLRLLGACVGCPSSEQTLAEVVERNLRAKVPGVSKVVCLG